MLTAAGGMGFLGFGAVIPGFLVFALPIRNALDISSAQFAFVVGAAWAIGNVAALVAGWLADRYGGRQLVLLGGLISCIGFGAVAYIDDYWQLVLAYSVVAAIGRGIGIVPNLMTIINQWFVRRKALAITILNTAFAGGAAVMVPALSQIAGLIGWRNTILWAGVMLCVLTLATTLVIRSRPEDIGLLPDGDPAPDEGSRPARGQRRTPTYDPSDFTIRSALATPSFWLLTVAVTLRIASADALVINQISLLVWKGVPADQAAYYLSLTFLGIIPLRFGMGLAATIISSRWLLFGGMTVGAVGTAVLLGWSGYGAAALFVLSIAATEGIATLGWLAVGEHFGRRSFGSLVGIMTVSFGVGSLLAPVAAGWAFDRTGTYAAVLIVAVLLQLGSGVCYFLARPPSTAHDEPDPADTKAEATPSHSD